jgi:predicted HicB family RNase H-like nuclease
MKKLALSYDYNISFDEEDEIYVGRCAELPSLMAHGKNQVQALEEIVKVVVETLKWMEEDGEELPSPFSLMRFSGKIGLRMSPEQHKRVTINASLQGISINKYITSKL